ncbi:DNA topoisomerase IV subunit B [Mesomycoplasma neurolyticum]|uniref:DNA topoisomerase (ATP-hydrolyzing) n=1 Tax=Mesomycoplasma neurolyticum TaxID=2120 RepID=A0A449A6J1_9BACT|nr:DNA topoisomerase IV subunit B [Mesomycoplasma neurolyticum]VEU59842.1 DNA gyrase subunit B [Mesomycoplasma neurolyticum]
MKKEKFIEYNADSIKILRGLEGVKKRPGMYIGSTDERGLHHLLWEIVDNAVDESLAGFANKINVTLKKDGSVIVEDNGRGIPIDINKETNLSGVELVFTELHAGAKFNEGAYKTSGGLHGVGSSVVNALSKFISVTVWQNQKEYLTIFENGGVIKQKTTLVGKTNKRGTYVRFLPDYEIFRNSKFSFEVISERLRETSFLLKNVTISLQDENSGQHEIFSYENGIKAFIEFVNDSKDPIHSEIATFHDAKTLIDVEFGFQYTNSYNENIISFVNNVKTNDGGTHETAAKTAFTKVFNEYVQEKNILKNKNVFEGSDIREGLTLIISLKIPESILEFVGQTKTKLGTAEAKAIVEEVVYRELKFWINENKEQTIKIIDKIKHSYETRLAARQAKFESKKTKSVLNDKKNLSGKLTPAQSKNFKERELFLVEGDSAGGSAKLGRDKKIQAILPLKGKVINAEKSKFIEIIKNDEITTIINAIGAGAGNDFNIKNCQYGKIIIMTDADTDGAHIQILLLTFLYRYMKPLIENEMIYIAQPPLYKITVKKNNQIFYAWNEEELKEISEKHKNFEIQRYKGLGEMNSEQLWDTTMNPATRTLIKVNIDDAILTERKVSILMGDKIDMRKQWINKHVNFEISDNFKVKITKENDEREI